jgi:hypothetical protein
MNKSLKKIFTYSKKYLVKLKIQKLVEELMLVILKELVLKKKS